MNTKNFLASVCLLTVICSPAVVAQSAEEITADSFDCIREMTPVQHFYVDNLKGGVEATVAVANSDSGGVYPEGAVVQLVPTEVMVKREAGFNPATKDWEFFELDVSAEGSAIRTRGFAEVNNRFGGNCFACHIKADAEWDLTCGSDHGCDPIPITRDMISALQKTDPRCDPVPLSEQDMANLKALQAAMGGG